MARNFLTRHFIGKPLGSQPINEMITLGTRKKMPRWVDDFIDEIGYLFLFACRFCLTLLCWRMQPLVGQYRHQATMGASVILSVAHPAIHVLLNQDIYQSTSKEGDRLREKTRHTILYLMDGGVSPRDLDANGFEALCKLITYQENTTPISIR